MKDVQRQRPKTPGVLAAMVAMAGLAPDVPEIPASPPKHRPPDFDRYQPGAKKRHPHGWKKVCDSPKRWRKRVRLNGRKVAVITYRRPADLRCRKLEG